MTSSLMALSAEKKVHVIASAGYFLANNTAELCRVAPPVTSKRGHFAATRPA